jgi:hypothetical protein
LKFILFFDMKFTAALMAMAGVNAQAGTFSAGNVW